MSIPILQVEQHWWCPSCIFTDVTHEPLPHSRMHVCAGLKGLTAPMVPEGVKAVHRTNEREDYIKSEVVQFDGDNRPVMNVVTTRDDGEDCTVFAPSASVRSGD